MVDVVCCTCLTNTSPHWFYFLIRNFVLMSTASKSYLFFFLQSQSRSQANACTQVFLENSLPHYKGRDVTSLLSYKAVMLEYARPKKEKLKSKGGSRINACQKRMMKIFKIKPEHQRLVHSLKPPIAGDFGKKPPIPLSPSYTLQIRAFPPSAWTLETVHHWLVWWPETHKVNEWEYCLGKPDLLYILYFVVVVIIIIINNSNKIMKFLFLLVVLSLIVWQTSLVCRLQQSAACAAEASEGRLPWCCTHRSAKTQAHLPHLIL